MNTYKELKLKNGDTIKLTLSLKRLLVLKTKNIDVYEDTNSIITKGPKDIFDMVKLIYAGYLCAADLSEEIMSYDAFLEVIPDDIGVIASTAGDLISPKKN